jgi:hypothetical protein
VFCLRSLHPVRQAGEHWKAFGACCTSDVDVPFAKAADGKVPCVRYIDFILTVTFIVEAFQER